MRVAIIGGSGKMGQWFARFCKKENMEVFISGRDLAKTKEIAQRLAVSWGTNEEIIRQADVVIISIPVDSFEDIAHEIAPCLRPCQKVLDITSVKMAPLQIMHRYFTDIPVLGTHPLFGPGAKGLAGMNFILTPTNSLEEELAQKVGGFLRAKGARVTLMDPLEHDYMMSVILGLTHFIALVTADILAEKGDLQRMKEISGVSFKALLTLVESVLSEDPSLYAAIQMSLPAVANTELEFVHKAAEWAKKVEEKDKEWFIARMQRLKSIFESNPDFGQSYEKMYWLAGTGNNRSRED